MDPSRSKGFIVTDDQRQWAITRIKAKQELRSHLVIYLAVNALLVAIWAVSSGGYFWPIWPIFGWGIGLAAHAASVMFGPAQITEEQINRELEGRGADRAPSARL